MLSDHWVVGAGLVVTSALALIANALLLLVFFRRRGLRTVSNRSVFFLYVYNFLTHRKSYFFTIEYTFLNFICRLFLLLVKFYETFSNFTFDLLYSKLHDNHSLI